MKQAMIDYMKNPTNDELYTPKEAILPILPYLERFRNKVFWECTDFGESVITKVLKENGFCVIGTHLTEGVDFLRDNPPAEAEIIITNPPYSLKTDFLKRAYELKMPFCFLLPITTLEGKERGKLFAKYGIEVAVLNKRINFMRDKKNVWFNTSWFGWQVFPEKLLFLEV